MRPGIIAAAFSVPDDVVATDTLQQRVSDASGVRIPASLFRRVTGIQSRHIAPDGVYSSTLAIAAGRDALTLAGRRPRDVDLLIFASATRDFVEPATAHVVQHALGTTAHCFDLTNACNSFLNGVDVAGAMIDAGRARTALVVTGETPSRSMRHSVDDLDDAIEHFAGFTFGDAGAAVVIEHVANGGILTTQTETNSGCWDIGGIFGGGSRHPRDMDKTYFHGAGTRLREVFERIGPSIIARTLASADLRTQDIAKVLVHQVTLPYLDRFVELTGVQRDKLEVTIPQLGNIASATLPLQLARVWDEITAGDRVLFVGLGGGASVMTMVWEKT